MTLLPTTRRAMLAAAGIGLSTAALAACSSDEKKAGPAEGKGPAPKLDADKKVTITFMHAMASGTQKPALEEIVKDFSQKFPNITVTLEEQPDYGTLQTKTKAQVGAGSAPTIAQAYENWAAEYAESQVIEPLDRFITDEDTTGMYEGVVKNLQLPDGKTWMWPFNKSVVVVYRNNEMVPEAPATWDEFATIAKEVSKDGVVALSIDPGSAKGPAGGTALFEILSEAFGGPVFAQDGTPQFDSEGPVAALKYLVDLKKANALAIGTGYPGQEALGAQKGAFDVATVASFPFNEKAVGGKFEMGVSPLPEGPKGVANQLAGTNLVMFTAADDDQKAAAWEFMKFVSSPEQQSKWAAATGYLPVVKEAFDLEPMKSTAAERPWTKEVASQLDTASALPGVKSVMEATGLLAIALQSALQGSAEPEAALKDAQEKASKIK